MIDIIERGFDAGLRDGDLLAKDMVAVPVAPSSEAVLVYLSVPSRRHSTGRLKR